MQYPETPMRMLMFRKRDDNFFVRHMLSLSRLSLSKLCGLFTMPSR